MELDLVLDPIRIAARVGHQLARAHAHGTQRSHGRGRGIERLLAGGRHGVARHLVLAHFVGGIVAQRELHAIVLEIGDGDGFLGHRDQWPLRLIAHAVGALLGRRHVGHEDVAPNAGADVAHIENRVGKILHEHTRCDIGAELRGFQLVPDGGGFLPRIRRETERGQHGDTRAHGGEQEHRGNYLSAGDAGRAHGGDLPIRRQPAQADQDSHQHAERNSERQHVGNGQKEQLEDEARVGGAAFHQQFQGLVDLAQVENEGGEQRAQHRARENLAKNVPA